MDQFDDKWRRRQERWALKQERWARKQQPCSTRHSGAHGVFVGGLIVTVGVLFLLDNLRIIRFNDFWQYWPVLLIVFGVFRIADSHGPAAIIWGGLVAGLGALLLLDNLNIIAFDWRIFWPVILIAWGLMMLLRPKPWGGGPPGAGPANIGDPSGFSGIGNPAGLGSPDAAPVSSTNTLSMFAIFGGGRRAIDSQDFRGGEISAIFGGYQVDLLRAAIAQDHAMIDVTAIFGGVEIKVPETWTVEARGIGIFGGFADETRPPRTDQVSRPQRLIVTGVAAFGGVSVKN